MRSASGGEGDIGGRVRRTRALQALGRCGELGIGDPSQRLSDDACELHEDRRIRVLLLDQRPRGAQHLDVRAREDTVVVRHRRKAERLPEPPRIVELDARGARDLARRELGRAEQRLGERPPSLRLRHRRSLLSGRGPVPEARWRGRMLPGRQGPAGDVAEPAAHDGLEQATLSPTRRLAVALAALISITVIGTVGYVLLEKLPVVDALYLTIVTLTTVGYGDLVPRTGAGRLFTVVLILSGVGSALYLFTVGAQLVLEGQLSDVFGRTAMQRRADQLDRTCDPVRLRALRTCRRGRAPA